MVKIFSYFSLYFLVYPGDINNTHLLSKIEMNQRIRKKSPRVPILLRQPSLIFRDSLFKHLNYKYINTHLFCNLTMIIYSVLFAYLLSHSVIFQFSFFSLLSLNPVLLTPSFIYLVYIVHNFILLHTYYINYIGITDKFIKVAAINNASLHHIFPTKQCIMKFPLLSDI